MTRSRSPFAFYNGKPYLVVNFDLVPPAKIPPHPELLDGLLAHHAPENILLLRPLTQNETRLLRESQRNLEVEAWAQMVVKEENRFRGRW